jgi:hypothetical protein
MSFFSLNPIHGPFRIDKTIFYSQNKEITILYQNLPVTNNSEKKIIFYELFMNDFGFVSVRI